jgi:hypothetical protein
MELVTTSDEHVVQGQALGLGLLSPRSRHLLMLEFGDREDFDNPRLEWRRLFSELLGTFALVLVAASGGILHGQGQIRFAAAVVAPGLMVMAIILFKIFSIEPARIRRTGRRAHRDG